MGFEAGHAVKPGTGRPSLELLVLRQAMRDGALRELARARDQIMSAYLRLASGPHADPATVRHAVDWLLGDLDGVVSHGQGQVHIRVVIESRSPNRQGAQDDSIAYPGGENPTIIDITPEGREVPETASSSDPDSDPKTVGDRVPSASNSGAVVVGD